jgi:hypothetical protein
MDTPCPFCQTRAALKAAEKLLDETPVIGADFYDETIADLINSISDALSTFQCYCNDPVFQSAGAK